MTQIISFNMLAREIGKITFILLLVLLTASLPYNIRISSILTVLLIISWIANGGFKCIKNGIQNRYVLTFLSLFILYSISYLYSNDKNFYHLEKKLWLLVFPLVLLNNNFSKNILFLIFWSFIISCAVAAVYSLYRTIDRPELLGTEMTKDAVGISHVYFGLYLSYAIVLLGFMIKMQPSRKYIVTIAILLIAFFLFVMFILSGKMSIISLFLLTVSVGFIVIVRSQRWPIGIALFLTPLIIFYLVFVNSSFVKERFSTIFNREHHFVGDNAWSSVGVRFTIFECSREVYKSNPIIGTGLGDVQFDLNECYKNLGFRTVLDMNAHNQYIQILLSSGVIGLVIFLIIIVYPSMYAIKHKNYLFFCFMFLFSFCCLTESLLERQQGVMFYALFSAFLFYNPLNEIQ